MYRGTFLVLDGTQHVRATCVLWDGAECTAVHCGTFLLVRPIFCGSDYIQSLLNIASFVVGDLCFMGRGGMYRGTLRYLFAWVTYVFFCGTDCI